jgi:hypothetical protein
VAVLSTMLFVCHLVGWFTDRAWYGTSLMGLMWPLAMWTLTAVGGAGYWQLRTLLRNFIESVRATTPAPAAGGGVPQSTVFSVEPIERALNILLRFLIGAVIAAGSLTMAVTIDISALQDFDRPVRTLTRPIARAADALVT